MKRIIKYNEISHLQCSILYNLVSINKDQRIAIIFLKQKS